MDNTGKKHVTVCPCGPRAQNTVFPSIFARFEVWSSSAQEAFLEEMEDNKVNPSAHWGNESSACNLPCQLPH